MRYILLIAILIASCTTSKLVNNPNIPKGWTMDSIYLYKPTIGYHITLLYLNNLCYVHRKVLIEDSIKGYHLAWYKDGYLYDAKDRYDKKHAWQFYDSLMQRIQFSIRKFKYHEW